MINFFSKYKLIFYISNFILLVLYLFPGSLIGCFLYNDCQLQLQLTKDFLVSTNHLYAFVLLSTIGIFTYENSDRLNFMLSYLILLSIILETLHIFIPERNFEFPDLFGNLLGVLIVSMINYLYKKYENYKN